MLRTGLFVVALCAGFASWPTGAARAQDFDLGLSAYNAADYTTAFGNWWPLAVKGDGKSQAALGYLYLKGLGVGQDASRAAFWFSQAADKGQPSAQYFLGVLYLDGRGVEQDFVKAHMWCDVAVSRGFPDGMSCRDDAAARLSAGELGRASRMIANWHRTHPR